MKIIVTGGAGFIGSAVVRKIINDTDHQVLNIDALTYAGDIRSLGSVADSNRYSFLQANICDRDAMAKAFSDFQPDAVMHLAAESHVDRSIDGPAAFIETNIVGTYTLLDVARGFWAGLEDDAKEAFRFHHISTDEVYGSLGETGMFTETTPYDPRSPYSASKASSDHLVRAWNHTYGLPTIVTNCSNNYGPWHFPEKLIPLMIIKGLKGEALPVYGDGSNVRDWLNVEDHANALVKVVTEGVVGETYNIGGHNEKSNLDVVHAICDLLDQKVGLMPNGEARRSLIKFVGDRPGHDQRYAIDADKIEAELGWTPAHTFESGIEETVDWYLNNRDWWQSILDGVYDGERLGNND